ncbi:MAG: putative motility protein [Afipia sp.]
MDMMSIVSSMMAMQAANTQQQIATSVLKQNIDSQKSVLQLLQPAPAANNAPGVGGNLDISV